MIELFLFFFLLPFNIFVWIFKYFGSLFLWIGLVLWVYQSRVLILDWLSDRWLNVLAWFRKRKKSNRINIDDIDDYIL